MGCPSWMLFNLAVATSATAAGIVDLPPATRDYLERHCIDCHDAEVSKGDFRIDTLSSRVGFEDNAAWLELMTRINSGEMPPEKVKHRPKAEESAQFVEWIAARLQEGEAARLASRDRVTYNRLTRDEYVNTLYDLLGVRYDAADPGAFLEDPEWKGFDRLGSVLTLSPSNIDKYLAAAETILDEAFPSKPVAFVSRAKRAVEEKDLSEPHRERLRTLGLLDQVRYDMWPGDIYRGSVNDALPAAGMYEFEFTLSGLKPAQGIAPRLKVYETRLDRVLHAQDVVAAEDHPITVTFQAHLPAGRPSISVYNDVPGPSNLPRSGRHGTAPFLSLKDGRIPWQIKLTDEAGHARYPFLILDSIRWRGPLVTPAEAAARIASFPPADADLEAARETLMRFARRAFRRPVTAAEVEPFVQIITTEKAAGENPAAAYKTALAALLCSKSFLFLTEGDPQAQRHTLTDWELASRLSYMLWSTMPDEELFRLAAAGRLRDPAVRAQQAARLLRDSRADRFADSFSTQWLRLRKVGMFPPDQKIYPDYDAHLEASMIGETHAFFRRVLRENRSLAVFLD
ncbi:MAG: DUF1592 domain-containing protein, partial [Verrucomicrobiales bacterium]|nr:DUF1592 domain-containing protein [Verrucomicrobiales bacterium]